ncbi:MAG: tetratricopeptide repeat protein [Thiotrichaceae bacterium]|nr:tetratricopeptide repeat protein [Thiotrichaceae bacterium]
MFELLYLLVPLAVFAGWHSAKRRYKKQRSDKRDVSDNLVKGINYLLSEQPDKALEVFISHPEINAHTAETYHLLGNLFRNRGEIDRALSVHQNLLSRPGLAKEQKQAAMLAYGEDFFAAGMLDRAEAVFQELIKETDNGAEACNTLRSIYEQLQDWDKAIAVCLNSDTNNRMDHERFIAHYYCELAELALEKGNIHLVEKYIKEARKSYKKSARIQVLQGDLEYRQGNIKTALKTYQQAISQDARLISLLSERLLDTANQSGGTEQLQQFLSQLFLKAGDDKILSYWIELGLAHDTDENQVNIQTHAIENSSNLKALLSLVKLWQQDQPSEKSQQHYRVIEKVLSRHTQSQVEFRCTHCGYQMNDFLYRCPACHHWDTIK